MRTVRSPRQDSAKGAALKREGPTGKIPAAAFDMGAGLHKAREQATKSVKDLGLAISSAIFAAQNTMKSKGLHFKREGKFRQDWLLTWMRWYSYVRVMCRKIWKVSSLVIARASSRARAADARIPFQ
jgi:hypothetical protein